MAPQGELEEARLHPRCVHLLDILGRVALLPEERAKRERHGEDEREKVAEGHDRRRAGLIGLVLLRAVMPEPDLVLIVEPRLVVLRARGVEDPLAEPLADRTEVLAERLAVRLRRERSKQVRVRADEAVPDVEDRFDVVLHDVVGHAQVLRVFVAEENALLHLREVVERHW